MIILPPGSLARKLIAACTLAGMTRAAVYMRLAPDISALVCYRLTQLPPSGHSPRRASDVERTKPPFRADHVGSLIRPDALIKARERRRRSEMPDGRTPEHPAGGDPRRGAPAGGDRSQGRHRRRVQPPLLAPRLHAEVRTTSRLMPSKLTVRFHSAEGDRDNSPPTLQGHRQAGTARRSGGIFVDDFKFLVSIARATPKITHPVADRDAFPRRARGDRRQGLSRHRRRSTTISRGSIARRSPTSRRPAAAICRSTRSTSPISAIPSCAGRSPISARTGNAAEDLRQAAQRYDPGPAART